MSETIYALGDTHGTWGPLKFNIKKHNIRGCTIIHVGDIGLGFRSKKFYDDEIGKMNELFAERDIQFLGIRGNHDDPEYFDGSYKFSNFELLQDYTVRKLGGKTFQFVGGAISVDRTMRIEGKSYWKDEIFVLDSDKIEECDVLITHSAPSWNGPANKDPIAYWLEKDETLWNELRGERSNIDKLVQQCNPKRHYCGHFHLSETSEYDGCTSRILNIDELLDITHHR